MWFETQTGVETQKQECNEKKKKEEKKEKLEQNPVTSARVVKKALQRDSEISLLLLFPGKFRLIE